MTRQRGGAGLRPAAAIGDECASKPDADTYALLGALKKAKTTCAAKHVDLLDALRRGLPAAELQALDVELATLTEITTEATTRLLADLRNTPSRRAT